MLLPPVLIRAILTAALALIFASGTAATAHAQGKPENPDTIDEGRAAYAAGDYNTALEKWQALIDQGRVEGLFFMGVMHAEGKGVERDPAKAFALYTAAAEKDHVPAQYNLANQYATGEGVAQDFSKAEYWWTKAAERGLLPAQVNLGNLYYHGAAGEKNPALARKWLSLAAAQGSADAKQTLARLDAEPAVAAAPIVTPADGLRREAWVLAQPEHHYTIQLLAAGADALARDFIQQQGLASRAAYIESAAQGAALFRVFYGSFAGRDQAEKALAALPRALTVNAPWVRTFAEVRKLVDHRHAQRGPPN